jgi:Tol biopolymer transport system component
MTPDGRFITFVANVTGFSGTNTAVYLWDALTATNTLVSINTNGVLNPAAICDSPAVSTNGQFVAFLSSSTDLTTNALAGDYHLYVRDAVSNVTQLVDIDLTGVGSSVSPTTVPSLNASGQLVAFECANANLVLNDRNHGFEAFVRDSFGGTTELVSGHHPSLPSVTPNGLSGFSFFTISGNGRYAAFASEADNLVANDTNGLRDVFMRDLLTGSNVLVSAGASGFAAAGLSTEPAISGDGRYVAFSSFATNLIASDTNTSENIFLRDLQSGTTTLVSFSINGIIPGNKDSYLPSISADGRYVLFHSKASNLAAGSFTGTENLFLRDLQMSTTYALTTNGLVTASMTPDGHFVAFVDSTGSGAGKIYLWNTQLAALSTINVLSIVTNISISPDGSQLASFGGSTLRVVNLISSSNVLVAAGNLNSRSGLQFSGNGSCLVYSLTTTNQVFLYDLQAGTNLLVSKSFNSSAGASGVSDSPAISADGRFVIYRSTATNIVANVASDFPNLFLFDRQTGANSLLTQSFQNGAPANNRSRTPIFSGNGRAVIFQSSASDIVAGDFNNAGDLLLYEFLYLDIIPGNSPLLGPTLIWPATPEQTYEVQYKNALDESNWQDVVGIVTILGNRAYLTDASPAPDQRFYRVIAY